MLTLAFNIQPAKSDWTWTETIYIRADGSVEPDIAPISSFDNITYTLTDSIVGNVPSDSGAIVIERDNIVLNGAGYTLQGTGGGTGIDLTGRINVTVQNMKIETFSLGIYLYPGQPSPPAVCLNNSISGNNITNTQYGIYLFHAKNTVLRNNKMVNNTYNLYVEGSTLQYVHDIDTSNTIDGKPIYYWVNKQNMTVPLDAGYVGLVNCTSITVQSLNLTKSGQGILVVITKNTTITENYIANNIDGIHLHYSWYENNTISRNNITNNGNGINGECGNIFGNHIVKNSNGILNAGGNIFENNITDNSYGIWGGGNIYENNITNNYVGILGGENIFENNIANNSGVGIGLSGGVVSTNKLTNNGIGVSVYGSDSTIFGNNITNNGYGIIVTTVVWLAKYNNISGNYVTANQYGISLGQSYMNVLRNNTMADNKYNLDVPFYHPDSSFQDVDTSNTVDGKPIYYWINRQNLTVPLDAGYVGLVNSTDITVQDLTLTKNGQGILLAYTTNSTLANNTITDNFQGISLKTSTNNNITENDIKNNEYGIRLEVSSSNSIYHNNFTVNTNQTYVTAGYADVWDDGYPSGGNYWSDYEGVDIMRGPNQNQYGSDGIGDTPYITDADNRDRYPLMKPYGGPHDIGVTNVTISKTGCLPLPTVCQGYTATINITILNCGNSTETFNVTLYANTTVIATFTNVTLTSRNSTTITFTWNTTGFAKGNYTIWACACPVLGETDTLDNTFPDGMILVTIPGDINGDTYVNAKDAVILGVAFNSHAGELSFNPNADINGDQWCNAKDAVILGTHFNEHW
jgi:parallel beta-helix repeat protein